MKDENHIEQKMPEEDFSDRLSPMLVKELRQGLRTNGFVFVFLGLQALLLMMLLISGISSQFTAVGNIVSRLIFLFFMIAVLVIQPLRGINSLYNEVKSTTMDLMVLTRLSAWKIILGKWYAIMGQTVLLFFTIIPYLILRYFFGGMNLLAEMLGITIVLYLSGCITALNVGLSGNSSILLRGILPLLTALGVIISIIGITGNFDDVTELMSLQDSDFRMILFTIIGLSSYIAWLGVALALRTIAPISENHSTFNRLVGLGVCLIAIILTFYVSHDVSRVILNCTCIIMIPVCVMALTDPHEMLNVVAKPFVRAGLIGKLFGRFFYPVFSTGVFFTLLIYALILAAMLLVKSYAPEKIDIIILNSILSSVFLPIVIIEFFFKQASNRIGVWLVITLLHSIISTSIYTITQSTYRDQIGFFFVWLPINNIFLSDHAKNHDVLLVITSVYAALLVLLTLYHAKKNFVAIKQAEKWAESSKRKH